MKAALISFAVGLAVGVLYGLICVKSPAPPLIALLGLLGIVIGEQFGGWNPCQQGHHPCTLRLISLVGEIYE